MDISKVELSDFNVYFRKEKINFPLLMKKMSNSEIKRKQLNAENGFHSVHFVKYENKKFIAKNDHEIGNRFEKEALNFISGPFYSHMIKRLARLTPERRTYIADPYYVTEKCRSRQCVEVSTVHEHTDGKPFTETNGSNAEEVKNCITKFHNTGLTSNDTHPGNSIRTPPGELKVIDLSCRGITEIRHANDTLTLRNKYNIDIQGHGFACNLILLKGKLRRSS